MRSILRIFQYQRGCLEVHEFVSFLAPYMRAFVSYRKASDRWNKTDEGMLRQFDKHCYNNYPNATDLSQEMADSWCAKHNTGTNNSCQSRIYPIISFIRYLRKRGLTTILEPVLPPREPRTYIPHAFTKEELTNFFAACDSIPAKPASMIQLSRRITIPVF